VLSALGNNHMRLSEFQYTLGPENIACEPHEVRLGRRDLGRMMIVDRKERRQSHSYVSSLPDILQPGDVLVLNNSKRIPGVLKARTVAEEAQVEIRFTAVESEYVGFGRLYPLHFVRQGARLHIAGGVTLTLDEINIGEHHLCQISSDAPLPDILKKAGLPITSFFYTGYWNLENYNNVFATEEGSLESPMAGLHFTPELLKAIEHRGIAISFITLHVVGSWLPPTSDDASECIMAVERYCVPESTAQAVHKARKRGGRVLACGTTVVRALESAAIEDGTVRAGEDNTSLRISPGFKFQVVDMYFTNFHPSRSSLILLDAAFCDFDLLQHSYEVARSSGYLFFEFGDAVLYA